MSSAPAQDAWQAALRRLGGLRDRSGGARTDPFMELVVVLVAFGLAFVSLREYIAPDYRAEIVPALTGLQQEGFQGFLDHLPGYPAAVVIEFFPAKLAMMLGGDEATVWRVISAFGISVLALATLASLPFIRATEASRGASRIAIALAVGTPTAYWALRIGHPEELMATGFLLASVFAAARERPILAGILLGLSIGKAWPAAAALPVLGLLLPNPKRVGLGVVASGATIAAIYLPSLLFAKAAVQVLADLGASAIFNVGQVFWWLGSPIPSSTVAAQLVPQPRVGPVWAGDLSHPLILGVGAAIGGMWCWSLYQRMIRTSTVATLRSDGRTRSREESAQLAGAALLVMAGILYARCYLDTWNVPYYLMGGLVLGGLGELLSGRRPLITLVATGIMWKWHAPGDLTVRTDPDVYTALYLSWTIPASIALLSMGFIAARRGTLASAPASVAGDAAAEADSAPDAAPAGEPAAAEH